MLNWQRMIGEWVVKTFGKESMNSRERTLRFLEESIELAQAHGITPEETNKTVIRVYKKPPGNPTQEVGGVMVTLLAFADYHQYNIHECLVTEWTRISRPTPEVAEKLQRSQREKLESGL